MSDKEQIIDSWSEWLLRRLDLNLSHSTKKSYIKMVVTECNKEIMKT